MRYDKRSRNRARKIKRVRVIILFIITAVFVIGGSVIMAQKFAEGKQAVQAAEVVDEQNNSNSVDEQNNSNSNDQNKTTDKNVLSSNESKQPPENSYTEDVAFVEKYLSDQMKGKCQRVLMGKKSFI